MSSPSVSLVILTCNKVEYSQRCLKSLLLVEHRPLEIVLIDNGSTDGTRDFLGAFQREAADKGIPVQVELNATNVGAVTGRNQALKLISGDFVCFLDNDVVVRTRSWVERMLAEFGEHPDTGAICPKLLFPFAPFLIQYAGLVIAPTGRADYLGRGKPHDDPDFGVRRELQASISACMMVPKPIVDQVGLMDEQFNPAQFEDIDYSYRIRQLGYKVIYLPSVEMYHFENVTTTRMKPGVGLRRTTVVNGLKFQKKWRHVFSKEDGPPAEEMHWEELPRKDFSEIGELEVRP